MPKISYDGDIKIIDYGDRKKFFTHPALFFTMAVAQKMLRTVFTKTTILALL